MRVFSFASILAFSCAAALVVVACGGSGGDGGTPPPGTSDAGDIGTDAGAIETSDTAPPIVADAAPPVDPSYPAKHPAIPLVDYNGGRVIVAPKIVTVTFPGDALKARLEAFGDMITTTKWWDAVIDGYCAGASCIGHGTAGGHVVLPAAAPSYTDAQGGPSTLQDMLQARVTDGTLPVPTNETIYVLYLPATTTVSMDAGGGQTATSCQEFEGYHGTATVTPKGGGATVNVPYAVVARCDAGERNTTITASHEIIEASTDPEQVGQTLGYYMTRNDIWPVLYGGPGEVGDLCVDLATGGALSFQESGFTVQRSWSNKAAKLAHNPCVPAPAAEVYAQVAPASMTAVVGVGKTVTVDLEAFSEGPTADWTVKAVDFGSAMQQTASTMTLSLDQKTINNGGTARLSITMKSAPAGGAGYVAIVSTVKGVSHLWPIRVTTN
jgi:hypothetical protein